MGCDTIGRMKHFVKHEDILEFIKKRYDSDATAEIKRKNCGKISEYKDPFKINEHSDNDIYHYQISGFIFFKDGTDTRMLFYFYSNLNFFENLEYYQEENLEEMVQAETTYISLGCNGNSIGIIRDILEEFNGGWLDENDCDDESPYFISTKKKLKVGGIYKRKYSDLNYIYPYFILLNEQNLCIDIDTTLNSNKEINSFLKMKVLANYIHKSDFFTSPKMDILMNVSDGYLGQVDEEILKRLEGFYMDTI